MSKNPLVATPIVDSRGRQTTVHKRADTGKPGLGASIPKVSIKAPAQDNCNIIVTHGFASDCLALKMSDNVRSKLMATLNDDTLDRMENLMRDHGVSTTTFRTATSWCVANRNFAVLNGFVDLVEKLENKDRDQQINVLYSLMGVQYSLPPKAPEIDITNPDDPRAEGGRVLANTILDNLGSGLIGRRNLKKNQAAYDFNDYGVGEFIREHPDRAEEILGLYRDREMFDKGLYETALRGGVPALYDGAL
jgi:hypothetical protein